MEGIRLLIRLLTSGAMVSVFCLSVPPCVHGDPLLQDIDRRLENLSLEKLAYVQADPDSELAPFTSDGCSGGMSEGWKYLADRFPSFGNQLGDKPPWERCCIAHDRMYWKGETTDGYDQRLQADKELNQCVIDTGQQLSDELADRFELSADQVKDAFNVAAALMYRAVRLGGKPCTRLPWRWGYGWPHCPLIIHNDTIAGPSATKD